MLEASAATGSALLRCEQLVVGYAGKPILPAIDVALARGSLTAVVGRNGAGKSTWLNTVLGLLPPLAGRVQLSHASLRLAYTPKSAQLDDALPVRAREVVMWSRLHGRAFLRPFASKRDRDACERALAAMSALDLADRPLRDLSQGQKQRVYFARMLAAEADVALLDEPTAAMDAVAQRAAFEQLAALAAEHGMAIAVVTHALGIATQHASQLLFLDREHGLALSGAPSEVLAHPLFTRHYGEIEAGHG